MQCSVESRDRLIISLADYSGPIFSIFSIISIGDFTLDDQIHQYFGSHAASSYTMSYP